MLISAYTDQWLGQFEELKEVLLEQLQGMSIYIEHVGSTSVLSMPAKPIIDLDLVYPTHAAFNWIKTILEDSGYVYCGDQGIAGREVFKRSDETHHPVLDTIPHHLYVVHLANEELTRHLLFRDHLRENQEARKKYAALKESIAIAVNQNKKEYARLKETRATDFIDVCIYKQKRINEN